MENPTPSISSVALKSSEQRKTYMDDSILNPIPPPMNRQSRSDLDGPVAILWDIENCPVPSDVRPEDVAGNIRMALRVHPVINGTVLSFSAFGDFNAFPRRLREGCQKTGVKLVDVPNGRKDAADKAILVDMFLFALDNPPPSSIMLISGDVDFAPALHILGQRGYTIVLVIPSGIGVSSALCNAGKFVWDWPSVARGEGFLPPARAVVPPRSGGPTDISRYLAGCYINEMQKGQNEEEAILYRGILQNYCNSRDYSVISHSLTEYNTGAISMPCFPATGRSHSLPSGLNEVIEEFASSSNQNDPISWVQPGDLNGLKGQLVKLLELSGGCLPLTRIPAEYRKFFGRPLYVSEYGEPKLVNLFRKMNDAIAVDGKGQRKFVYLRNWKASETLSEPLSAPPSKEKKSKENEDHLIAGCCVSSDELSDEDHVLMEEQRNKSDDRSLQDFKNELQEILVSYSCRIFLGCFETVYEQRYKRPLDYQKLGVGGLEELFEKMRDVVKLHEDPASNRKFISAICW